jgi:excisionase family DNA binding protein
MIKNTLYTAPEVADILRVDLRTVYRWIKSDKLRAVKVGRRWRISSDTLKTIKKRGLSD